MPGSGFQQLCPREPGPATAMIQRAIEPNCQQKRRPESPCTTANLGDLGLHCQQPCMRRPTRAPPSSSQLCNLISAKEQPKGGGTLKQFTPPLRGITRARLKCARPLPWLTLTLDDTWLRIGSSSLRSTTPLPDTHSRSPNKTPWLRWVSCGSRISIKYRMDPYFLALWAGAAACTPGLWSSVPEGPRVFKGNCN